MRIVAVRRLIYHVDAILQNADVPRQANVYRVQNGIIKMSEEKTLVPLFDEVTLERQTFSRHV